MYHFIGIKGAGMSALAVILKQLGYSVKGSDISKHFFTETELINNSIPYTSYDESNITKNLTIIKGASIKDDNIELIQAKKLNLEIIEYQEMLGLLTQKYQAICISGCHGKTTTTAMTAHVLDSIIGINYLIGDGTGHADKNNKFLALESCEYQRHFLSYNPYYTIILNIDLDHVDYYHNLTDLISAYEEFANKTYNRVLAFGDDKNIQKMHLLKKPFFFGLTENNDLYAKNIIYKQTGISFDTYVNNTLYGHFDLPIFGLHQLIDALSVISLCYLENISSTIVNEKFQSFTGAKRRFTETIVNNNIIIDDYAHHPNEIKSTIDAIEQKYPDKKIISIFQPHTFTRTQEFGEDIAKVLSKTHHAYIMDIHPAREKQEDFPTITKDIIISKMTNASSLKMNEAAILNKYDNAVFIFMSPNDLSPLEEELIKLKENSV